MRVSYAIVFVSDMSRAVAFYRDVVGLPFRFESPDWTEFNTDGATLALHASDGARSQAGTTLAQTSPAGTTLAQTSQAAVTPAQTSPAAAGPAQTSAGHCRPGLSVPDLDAFHRRMSDAGVFCVQPPRETFGARIAQYRDPDGLVISVSEQR